MLTSPRRAEGVKKKGGKGWLGKGVQGNSLGRQSLSEENCGKGCKGSGGCGQKRFGWGLAGRGHDVPLANGRVAGTDRARCGKLAGGRRVCAAAERICTWDKESQGVTRIGGGHWASATLRGEAACPRFRLKATQTKLPLAGCLRVLGGGLHVHVQVGGRGVRREARARQQRGAVEGYIAGSQGFGCCLGRRISCPDVQKGDMPLLTQLQQNFEGRLMHPALHPT